MSQDTLAKSGFSPQQRFLNAFACPERHTPLVQTQIGLMSEDGHLFPFLNTRTIDFISPYSINSDDARNLDMYNAPASTEMYRNFLDWLFATFNEEELSFRQNLLKSLNLCHGDKVLITSVGLGDDIPIVNKLVGPSGEIHAQDISKAMVLLAESKADGDNVMFSVSNGNLLPHKDRYFDAVFHFGGINLFGDTKKAIAELERVCKIGGRVVFGDEGIAPHLRGTEYAKIAIANNRLWEQPAPLDLLPPNAHNVQLNWVLGNCFYVIGFDVGKGLPYMNIDIKHIGIRGGTARTRYFGQLEGVTETSKNKLLQSAKERKMSVHDLLEEMIDRLT